MTSQPLATSHAGEVSSDDALIGLEPGDVLAQWNERGFAHMSDGELVDMAARHLAVPRLHPADSFVLHAPLELMARSSLLRFVEPASRERARQRIVWEAATYETSGPSFAGSPRDAGDETPPPAVLREAIAAGDLDGIDRATIALCATTSAGELVVRLADLVVARLAAAAHGPIFLYHLPRVVSAEPAAGLMARGLMREIGRQPTWELTWMDERDPAIAPTRDLRDRLCLHLTAGDPGSNFIYPTMSLVERVGLAHEMLASSTSGLSVPDARRDLLRVAAWSMLQDDPEHAPYGWSHALTMPQATLGIAPWCTNPDRAVAVAATFLLGFRATLGAVALDESWQPARRDDLDARSFLDAGPDAAAAEMWHAAPHDYPDRVWRVVTFAALHPDAHLAKYTLACIDATRDDPGAGRLYMAAAGFLAGWWRADGTGVDLINADN